jgi:hypothetical protein
MLGCCDTGTLVNFGGSEWYWVTVRVLGHWLNKILLVNCEILGHCECTEIMLVNVVLSGN